MLAMPAWCVSLHGSCITNLHVGPCALRISAPQRPFRLQGSIGLLRYVLGESTGLPVTSPRNARTVQLRLPFLC